MQTVVSEELEESMGAAELAPQPSSQPVTYKDLLLGKAAGAVAEVKHRRPPTGELIDLSDHHHRRFVSRAHVQHCPYLVAQPGPTFRIGFHMHILLPAPPASPPYDGKPEELETN